VLETAKGRFLFRVTQSAREFLLKEGTDLKYGARHLKRAIERRLVYPIANLLSTEQVRLGDMISVDCVEADSLVFLKEAEGALIPLPALQKPNESAIVNLGGRAIPVEPGVAVAERLPLRPTR
jgi:hypothetical protein